MAASKVKMFRRAKVLNYRDEKPTVYKLQQLTYPAIKEKDLVRYICNSSNIPESTLTACLKAIAEGIVYFAINGHRVVFDGFGGFYINVRTKTAKSEEALTAENIVSSRLAYVPATELRELISAQGTEIVNNSQYGIAQEN